MANAKDIRRRIRTVKSIEKITSAMKMVAAARLRKAQERAEAARPYAEKMHEVMGNLAQSAGEIQHPLLEVREQNKIAYVVIGAERGLAGSYNGNVMSKALRAMRRKKTEDVKIIAVGRKSIAFFKKQPYEIVGSLETSGNGVSFVDIRSITAKVRSMFESGEVDAVYLVYAKFVTAMTQKPTVVNLLPMTAPNSDSAGHADFIFEPEPGQLLGKLLPRYLETQIYQSLVESNASEQGARMSAMSAATKNAGEMIDNLTLIYNKARQASITTELTEIVSGAEAQK